LSHSSLMWPGCPSGGSDVLPGSIFPGRKPALVPITRSPGYGYSASARICAAPDPLLGEQVCAFVVPRPGAHVDLDVVRTHFAGLSVARHKTPERVKAVIDLPRTATGKVKKTELRALLRTERRPVP
jgi:acyl-CoA synthetase (AMP-forming)/AMP-acid ligase II